MVPRRSNRDNRTRALLLRPFLLLVAAPITLLPKTACAWRRCSNLSPDICPDGNTCCLIPSSQTYTCLSGKNETLGHCCHDDLGGRTGCGDGFQCARNDEYDAMCERNDPENDLLPAVVPRYQLCSLSPRSLQQVYGLPMREGTGDNAAYADPPANPATVAYLSNLGALDTMDQVKRLEQAATETAWIVIHGSGRNPDDYLCCAQSAAESNTGNGTMIVVPWFLAPTDKVTSDISFLRWTEQGPIPHTWRYGADAIDHNVSSYTVVDAMIQQLANKDRFPSLKRIVVAGHSAGGQYVQRWALLTNNAFLNDNTVPIRVVVANPKSFCWLDDRRIFPDGQLRRPDQDALYLCPAYNEWEWGWDNSTRTTERDA